MGIVGSCVANRRRRAESNSVASTRSALSAVTVNGTVTRDATGLGPLSGQPELARSSVHARTLARMIFLSAAVGSNHAPGRPTGGTRSLCLRYRPR